MRPDRHCHRRHGRMAAAMSVVAQSSEEPYMPFDLDRRRRVVRSAAAILAAALASTSFGAAPQQKTQAPGYYRMNLGDFEVTVVSDGTFSMDMSKLLARATPDEVRK